jgi:hypothetical protein
MKQEILNKILQKITECENRTKQKFGKLVVDRIDVVALKELYIDIKKNL